MPVVAGVHVHQMLLSTLNGPGSPASVSAQTLKSKSLIGPLPTKVSGKAKSLLLTFLVAASSTLIRFRVTPLRVTLTPVALRSAERAFSVIGTPLPSTHSRSSAIAPTTCGVAIDVPSLLPWLLPVGTGASMLTPGAQKSRSALELVKLAGHVGVVGGADRERVGAQPGKLVEVFDAVVAGRDDGRHAELPAADRTARRWSGRRRCTPGRRRANVVAVPMLRLTARRCSGWVPFFRMIRAAARRRSTRRTPSSGSWSGCPAATLIATMPGAAGDALVAAGEEAAGGDATDVGAVVAVGRVRALLAAGSAEGGVGAAGAGAVGDEARLADDPAGEGVVPAVDAGVDDRHLVGAGGAALEVVAEVAGRVEQVGVDDAGARGELGLHLAVEHDRHHVRVGEQRVETLSRHLVHGRRHDLVLEQLLRAGALQRRLEAVEGLGDRLVLGLTRRRQPPSSRRPLATVITITRAEPLSSTALVTSATADGLGAVGVLSWASGGVGLLGRRRGAWDVRVVVGRRARPGSGRPASWRCRRPRCW